jgi:hypothetical protein
VSRPSFWLFSRWNCVEIRIIDEVDCGQLRRRVLLLGGALLSGLTGHLGRTLAQVEGFFDS